MNTAKNNKRGRLTVVNLADYLDIPVSVAYRGLQTGQIPSRKIDGRYIIFRSAIDRWRLCEKATSVA